MTGTEIGRDRDRDGNRERKEDQLHLLWYIFKDIGPPISNEHRGSQMATPVDSWVQSGIPSELRGPR